MGEKRRRSLRFSHNPEPIMDYVRDYHQSAKTLISAYDTNATPRVPEFAVLSSYELWQCTDGVVVLAVPSDRPGDVNLFGPIGKTMSEFLSSGKETNFYDESGRSPPPNVRFGISIGTPDEAKSSVIFLAAPTLTDGSRCYRPKYVRAIMAGWDANLGDPADEAVIAFKTAFAVDNIVGEQSKSSPEPKEQLLFDRARNVLSEYRDILHHAEREEELQVYLKQHPELLYPDLINVWPKLKLGAEYVTDFVVLVESGHGPEYVFIEIERPNKRIFTEKGHFHSDFTQAKDQLLDWERWITQNISYLQQSLTGVYKPTYHLVYGRDEHIDEGQREKLRTEFGGTTRRFSTYDGLAQRFETIIDKLTESRG